MGGGAGEGTHSSTRAQVPYGRQTKWPPTAGHSSCGWAALWLQVAYPSVFGGTWATAPDPADFRAFLPVDLTRDKNIYHNPDGSPRIVMRLKGTAVTMEDYARRELVLGEYGGQLSSFEAVFSPSGADGRP